MKTQAQTQTQEDERPMPLPATYLVAPDGNIAFAYINPNYLQRVDPQRVIDALDSIAAA